MNLSKRQDCQLYVQRYIYVIHRLGGPYWTKLYRSTAVLKTEGTVFPITPQPRPLNNISIFSSREQGLGLITDYANKSAQGSWTRRKNSVRCRNQSDCMIYRIQPARTLRKKGLLSDCLQAQRKRPVLNICKIRDQIYQCQLPYVYE